MSEEKKCLTGYSSVDKPWEKFFKQDKLHKIHNDKTVYQDIVCANEKHLSDLAIMFFGAKITYKELFAQIDATAKSLKKYGVKKGDYVTVCCAGIPEVIYVVYALAKIGAIANLMAPYFDSMQMTDRINDCKSRLLIVMDSFYSQIKEAINRSSIETIIVVPTLNSSVLRLLPSKNKLILDKELLWNKFIRDGRKTDSPDTFEYEKDYPLCLVYSSGTTGASKAIVLTHDSFQYSVLSYDANTIDIIRGQKLYQIVPPWYSTGLNTSIHLPLHGGIAIFQDPRFEREIFVKNVIKHQIEYTIAPTSMYEGFLDEQLIKGKKLRGLKYPFEGGEALTKEVKAKIEQKWREMGNDAILRVAYGQCECGAQATSQSQNIEHPEGSVGIPIPGVIIGIFDDSFKELKYNERGNILINTPCGMKEYFNKPEETDKYFYYDENSVKWSCTGDIGYMSESGDLFVEGRKEDFTIVNNKKIYNFDIENAVRGESDIKLCDCVENESEIGIKGLALHLIFTEEYANNYNSNQEQLLCRLREIQTIIFEKHMDVDMVPKLFKIRKSFPYKPSGKRDVESLANEKADFVYLNFNE
ncbi:MAG: acyl--CoA ligase [Lachnospiraceae bacterium]|nr:acyl--CoA ligase [Lachnospiraceae bacterium]